IIDPYVPPEGDARLSSLSKEGLKQKVDRLKQTAASQLAKPICCNWVCFLCSFNKQKLHSLVTERCYPEMVRGNRYKTIRWGFVESLEPPRLPLPHLGGFFGLFSQILAIYDRFGRLMYGGEEVPKDVLEYVVFERYLVNPYGSWRMHGKIIPEWAPPKDPIIKVMPPGEGTSVVWERQ
ncbi:RM45 protein, partial [Formicarius rufipectus]|nr:RM45 protein [Formicarius rufipectus]